MEAVQPRQEEVEPMGYEEVEEKGKRQKLEETCIHHHSSHSNTSKSSNLIDKVLVAIQLEGSSATQGGAAVSTTGVGALQTTVQRTTVLLSAGLVSNPSTTQHLFSQ
ncbi:hypothetical protein SUGI_0624650 [Cryptomeria japonica]|nr:hypothetical protein SUGI_0624650 [Cryptomeria japonica]